LPIMPVLLNHVKERRRNTIVHGCDDPRCILPGFSFAAFYNFRFYRLLPFSLSLSKKLLGLGNACVDLSFTKKNCNSKPPDGKSEITAKDREL